MALDLYLLLSLTDPASGPAGRELPCLNSAGRWAVDGTDLAPLLVWRPADGSAAQAAAARAAEARGLPVHVVSRADSRWVEGRQICPFSDALEAALVGYEAFSAGRTRRLRLEADKLEAFCLIVRAASAAQTHEAFTQVAQAAAQALRAKFGAGSVTSAFTWLGGREGRDALQSVRQGEVELLGDLSLADLQQAVALARAAQGESP